MDRNRCDVHKLRFIVQNRAWNGSWNGSRLVLTYGASHTREQGRLHFINCSYIEPYAHFKTIRGWLQQIYNISWARNLYTVEEWVPSGVLLWDGKEIEGVDVSWNIPSCRAPIVTGKENVIGRVSFPEPRGFLLLCQHDVHQWTSIFYDLTNEPPAGLEQVEKFDLKKILIRKIWWNYNRWLWNL